MFHGVEILKLQDKGTQGYLKAVKKDQIIQWIRGQSHLKLSDLKKK
jgi:2-polyprenyl-3-methyl-5-hydroxy-6-metoxy-1,4-benzoquinol methylase